MNVVEVLQELGINFKRAGEHHHVSGQGWLGTDCPNCSPGSGKYKLGIREDTGHTSCWTCGHVDLLEALRELSGRPTSGIIELLSGLDRYRIKKQEKVGGKLKLPDGLVWGELRMMPLHRGYLERRGFDVRKLIEFWKLGSIGLAARLAWRIFVPIHLGGKVVSWTTRSVADKGVRYVSAPADCEEVPAKHLLYGEDHVRHGVIVCEGPADVWKIGPGAVATMGIGWTREQLLRISRFPVRAICFDSEPLAQERAKKLCLALEPFCGTTMRVELDAKDAGSAGGGEIRKLRKAFLE